MEHIKLFEQTTLGGLKLRNRIVMAPMTTWASNDDGTVSDAEDAYYRARVNGVGLVITGCTHVSPEGIGFTGEFAANDDRFVPSLKRLAAAAKSGGAPAILQIFHAGVKAVPDLVPQIVGASAVPTDVGPFSTPTTPRPLNESEIVDVIHAFVAATRRAILAGFDGVELHGAHGFLIQNFVSPYFNRRDDRWGGLLENRMRFPLALIAEVRSIIEEYANRPFLLGYRISPEEPNEGGLRISDSLRLIDKLIEGGIDYLHASLTSALEARPIGAPEGPTIAQVLRDHVAGRLPLVGAGQLRTPEQAEKALAEGLSLVAIGQGLVMNPEWVQRARSGDEVATSIARQDVPQLRIPQKLWSIIEGTPGWFQVREAA